MSWAEAKWIADKLAQNTGRFPNAMRAFEANTASATSIRLTFSEPEDSYDANGNLYCAVGGAMIRMSETGYPTSPSDGTLAVNNTDLGKYETNPFTVTGLTKGKTYYFTAFPYSAQGVYNLSGSQASVLTADGETANVSITIDDASGFTSTVVTCVDETDSALTQTATLTASVKTTAFTVAIGHNYHIEYGAVANYSQPSATASKTAVGGTTSVYTGAYKYFTAGIVVTYPAGATCTCAKGETVYTASTTTGLYAFAVHEAGVWTLTATDGAETTTGEVTVTTDGESLTKTLSFVKIYGISRNRLSSSPIWTRTDDAVGKTATASVGTTAGVSDFDDCYPWNGIVRETKGNDVMVKIPKFYYQRYVEANIEYIRVAEAETEGFALHPAFNHGGVEKDSVYVGAYELTGTAGSKTGTAVSASSTFSTYKTAVEKKGTGWGLFDISTFSAVQMLMLVEFATNNMQNAVGLGNVNANAAVQTGTCDSVPNLTGVPSTGGTTGVVWRGIENLWGNVHEFLDGITVKDYAYYVCNDQSKYDAASTDGYTELSYNGGTYASDWSNYLIVRMGIDENNSHIMLPEYASNSSSTSLYYCDTVSIAKSVRLFTHGGLFSGGNANGLFKYYISLTTSSAMSGRQTSRIMYVPQ